MRRQVGAGAQAVLGQDRRDHPDRRGLAVRADDVDRVEATARGVRARSSAAACGRGRTASRTARARAGSARRHRGRSSQRRPARPAAARACRAQPGRRWRAPLRRTPRWRASAGSARPPIPAGRVRHRACAGRRRGRAPSPARISTAPPGIGTAATGTPPSAVNSIRASRATCSSVVLVAVGRQPRRERGAGLDPGVVAPAAERPDRLDRACERGLGRPVGLETSRRGQPRAASSPAAPGTKL